MLRDYTYVSPSLEGILSHSSLEYEGLKRPLEVLRALDGPAARGNFPEPDGSPFGVRPAAARDENAQKIIEAYFHDLYVIFMKRLSSFATDPSPSPDEELKLQAFLQEMIKIKRLLRSEE